MAFLIKVYHNTVVRMMTKRMKNLSLRPPRHWSDEKCFRVIQDSAIVVHRCRQADDVLVKKFTKAWYHPYLHYSKQVSGRGFVQTKAPARA